MTTDEIAQLTAERLQKALADAAGVKVYQLTAMDRIEFMGEAIALLAAMTKRDLVVLPVEVFRGGKADVSIESQDGAGVLLLPAGSEAGKTADPATDDQGVQPSGAGAQGRAVPESGVAEPVSRPVKPDFSTEEWCES